MIASGARRTLLCVTVLIGALGMTTVSDRAAATTCTALDRHAAEYLGLVADLGVLDPESIDFQVVDPPGPPRRPAASPAAIAARSAALAAGVRAVSGRAGDSEIRAAGLAAQLDALAVRAAQLTGASPSLDEELAQLFAASRAQAAGVEGGPQPSLDELDRLLPRGGSSLSQRLTAYQRRFVVPRGRLHDVVTGALGACREQTRRFLALPPGERISVEYVADRPWSAYSVYRGGYYSVVQINRAVPITVGQALNLACHEAYPGHHTYNSLLDQRVVRGRGWLEAGALPLFSPAGFRAEAAASAAAAIVFSPEERARVFRDELFPLAGLDAREAERYVRIGDLVEALSSEATDVLLAYLAGGMTTSEAARDLDRRALMAHPEALLAYVDRYRGYALAYTWGRDDLLAALAVRAPANGRAGALLHLMTSSERDPGRQQ